MITHPSPTCRSSPAVDSGRAVKKIKRTSASSATPSQPPPDSHRKAETTLKNTQREDSSSDSKLAATSDQSRNKCIEMFYQALLLAIEEKKVADPELHEPFEIDNAVEASIKIEKCLFEQHGNPSNDAYKKAFRSKYLNLKDKANPGLRGQILSGDISPSDFIKMSPSEMASEERRKEDDRINKENLLKARAAKDNESETDMFQCSRCKQRKCKYFQLQTRSADEPMTTYVTCIHCGHRWRM